MARPCRPSPSLCRGILLVLALLVGRAAGAAEPDVLGAQTANAAAMRKYRQKDFPGALADLRSAVSLHPAATLYRYNLACLASLAGDVETALRELETLRASPQPEAKERIRRAGTDPDLAAARQDPRVAKLLATAVAEGGGGWEDTLPGFVPLAESAALAGPALAGARAKLKALNPVEDCQSDEHGEVYGLTAELDAASAGKESLICALRCGIAILDAGGKVLRSARFEAPFGSRDQLHRLGVGHLRGEGSLDVVIEFVAGGREISQQVLAALAPRGATLEPIVWTTADESGTDLTLPTPLRQVRGLRLELPGLLSLRRERRTHLFRWTEERGRFEPLASPVRAASATKEKGARRRAPIPSVPPVPLPPMVAVREVRATSTYASRKQPQRYSARNALFYETWTDEEEDEDAVHYSSMWCEGRPDEGIGEALTITLAGPTRVDALSIAAGVWKSRQLFTANNRIARLEVSVDGQPPLTVEVPARMARARVKLGAKPVTTIAVRIARVTRGKINDSCLTAVDLLRGDTALTPVEGVDEAALAALPATLGEIHAALGSEELVAKRLQPLLGFPLTVTVSVAISAAAESTVVHPSLKALLAAHRAYQALDEDAQAAKLDPRPSQFWDPGDDRRISVRSTGAGIVVVDFPSHNEWRQTWTLVYGEGRWRLTESDYS